LLFLDLMHVRGSRRTILSIPFQLCVLSAATVVVLPNSILLPGFHHALVYIAERMSLGVGVCVCAMLAAAHPGPWKRISVAALSGVFFMFLYVDERALNRFEDQMQGVVAQLPPDQRVVSAIKDPSTRANAIGHVIDRVCLGRCFSYANYEPSTAQFRIRVLGPNQYVVPTYADSWAMQDGKYKMKDSDPPLWQVDLNERGQMVVKSLKAGNLCGSTSRQVVPRWMSRADWRRDQPLPTVAAL
jgi:hypothetical protein